MPIRLPSAEGAFPVDYLFRPPPVVPDANRLRNDILYACRHNRRTVLVNAANGGLMRLFCAQHVVDEVAEHSAEWTAGSPVTRKEFLARWLTEYLPLIRVVHPDEGQLTMLSPGELGRIQRLRAVDPDDVPSATIALLLGAFFLSDDGPALRAVYGGEADLAGHAEWVNILKAGGDAGELGKMFTFLAKLADLAGTGIAGAVRRVVAGIGPWIPLVAALWGVWKIATSSDRTRQRIKSAAQTALTSIGSAFIAYEEVHDRFERAAPKVPSWRSLAESNPPGAVLARACLHTLARSPASDRSAQELARDLPYIYVPQGEAKVRETLRAMDCFTEVGRGRWQVGDIAEAMRYHLLSVFSHSDR